MKWCRHTKGPHTLSRPYCFRNVTFSYWIILFNVIGYEPFTLSKTYRITHHLFPVCIFENCICRHRSIQDESSSLDKCICWDSLKLIWINNWTSTWRWDFILIRLETKIFGRKSLHDWTIGAKYTGGFKIGVIPLKVLSWGFGTTKKRVKNYYFKKLR